MLKELQFWWHILAKEGVRHNLLITAYDGSMFFVFFPELFLPLWLLLGTCAFYFVAFQHVSYAVLLFLIKVIIQEKSGKCGHKMWEGQLR